MAKAGFDNDKYLRMQSEHIKERINQFGGKLYLEFGGKIFDDYHASRVLPGFLPDSKMKMLLQLKDSAEMIIAINANDIEKNKIRGDIGITYDLDVLRLMDIYKSFGLRICGVVLTQFGSQPAAIKFEERLAGLGIKTYRHYKIENYPNDIQLIVSDNGYGKNDYIETTQPLVVVTAPGPGSGKMAVCLSQLYHEQKRGIEAGYAKFETFPIWNLPLKHPVNLAYEAATTDLNDVNMIDPFHLEAYGKTTVKYIMKYLSGFTAFRLINRPPIWGLIWRVTAFLTTTRLKRRQSKRLSAGITRRLSKRKTATMSQTKFTVLSF